MQKAYQIDERRAIEKFRSHLLNDDGSPLPLLVTPDCTSTDLLIVVAPARRVRGKQSLKELVSRIPKDYKCEELDWGEPVGGEAW